MSILPPSLPALRLEPRAVPVGYPGQIGLGDGNRFETIAVNMAGASAPLIHCAQAGALEKGQDAAAVFAADLGQGGFGL